MFIFLDETGQLTKNKDEKYFIVGTFTTGDPRRTGKRFTTWKRQKFPKKLKFHPEIKFSNSGIDDNLRLRTLREIAKLDVRIRYGFIHSKNIPLDFLTKGKVCSGYLYTEIVSNVIEAYLPISDRSLSVYCDVRNLKNLKKGEFKNMMSTRILSQLPTKSIFQIDMLDSKISPNIQIADWICGALGRFYNKKKLGKECFDILKNNLLGDGVEIFKDHWLNNQKTQSVD